MSAGGPLLSPANVQQVTEKPKIRRKSANRQTKSVASGGCTIHIQKELKHTYKTATWMGDLYRSCPDVSLNSIIIPGSHDSATDLMTKNSPYARFNKLHRVSQQLVYQWAKTQHHPVHTQLQDGIRYLDLRIEKTSSGWKTFHGLLSNCFIDVLDDIARFANDHPREIVIVDFQHLVNFTTADHHELVLYCIQHPLLGPRLAGTQFTAESTFRDFWAVDKNVILLYTEGNAQFPHLFWHRRQTIDNPWHNTPKAHILQTRLLEGVKTRTAGKFYVSQLVLTPDLYRVISGLFSGMSSLFTLSVPSITKVIEGGFLTELDYTAKQAGQSMNVVIVDFYEHSNFVLSCLRLNTINTLSRQSTGGQTTSVSAISSQQQSTSF